MSRTVKQRKHARTSGNRKQPHGASQEMFEEALAKWNEEMAPVYEANRDAERISAEDLKIVINAKA
jgi:hypothetical protein